MIDNIDRARKQCLWRGNDPEKKGGNLVAWEIVQQPKDKGGLGVLNLRLQNDALLLKQSNKFYNKVDTPWVQLVWSKYYESKVPHAAREMGFFGWKDILRLNTIYRGIATCTVGNGSTVCFWDDLWTDFVLSIKYPRLVSFARKVDVSVLEVMQADDLDSLFILPLSAEALHELDNLQAQLQTMPYDDENVDSWVPVWGSKYSSRRFYREAFSQVDAHPVFRVMWKSNCMPRIKFFVWLVLVDRLNTKTMLQRRHINIQGDANCVMCNAGVHETIEHLFFMCPFAQVYWETINFTWDESLSLHDRLIKGGETHSL
jgi:hypothetical protein